jgi:GT2 family glycosyltransferase
MWRRMGAAPGETVELPSAKDPLVSVVVLLTREAELAERCLRAIADGHERDVPTEVVLVLNAPDEDTLTLVEQRVTGARIVSSPVNTGTGPGWNLGFGAARGRWVALLHEDSEPEPGWLGPLLDTAERHPRAAVVGSRLVWSDPERAGELWNGGNIMWKDAMPGHLTDEAVEDDGPYVCDHCSSAAAMFEREAWQSVGGFDERYFPAVRHELDLCVALWRAGRTVMCDPRSTVLHRGAAMVRPGAGALESWEFRAFLADRSQRLLSEKWGDALAAYEERPAEHPAPAADLRRARERTVARAAAALAPMDRSPRSERPLTAPEGCWPDAVDAEIERRLLAAQVTVQSAFCDVLAGRLAARDARVRELEAEVAALAPKAHTHDLILAGRWWRLRGRIDPAVRAGRRLRRAIRPGAAPGI